MKKHAREKMWEKFSLKETDEIFSYNIFHSFSFDGNDELTPLDIR